MNFIRPIFFILLILPEFSWAKLYMTNANGIKLVNEAELGQIANDIHQQTNRCGGFVVTESPLKNAKTIIQKSSYSINRFETVKGAISLVEEENILSFIRNFSSYPNRYYTSISGIKAMHDLAKVWHELTKHRNDTIITTLKHRSWPQPSIILTIKGKSSKEIIIGGHGDSINTDHESNDAIAPGADDNASGIGTITEIIRVLMLTNYAPQNTLTFIAYAAEEVGLRGSMDIAENYSNKDQEVLGVLQFDGTNYNGSHIKFALISDNTDHEQNIFLGNLIDQYLQLPWGYDECHYACSDHFSWTHNGYKASFPAEAIIKEENPHIHTSMDTLEVSNNTAIHATHFSKLGLAYIIELDK